MGGTVYVGLELSLRILSMGLHLELQVLEWFASSKESCTSAYALIVVRWDGMKRVVLRPG